MRRRLTAIRSPFLAAAVGSMACASTTGGSVADASIVDRVPPDRSCTGLPGPSRVEGVDPVTGCPVRVYVERRVTVPMDCERLEPRCSIPTSCRFEVALTATPTSACGRPARQALFRSCRCEFGIVECPGEAEGFGNWPGCTANALLCDPCRR